MTKRKENFSKLVFLFNKKLSEGILRNWLFAFALEVFSFCLFFRLKISFFKFWRKNNNINNTRKMMEWKKINNVPFPINNFNKI